jgi:predicted transcriptional regulator
MLVLSNPNRLRVFLSIYNGLKKPSQIVKHTNLSFSEVSRHLKKLSSSGIILKHADNTYSLTSIGHILNHILSLLNFSVSYRDILLEHDISVIPFHFLFDFSRMKNISVIGGTIEGFNLTMQRLEKAEKFSWVISPRILSAFIEPFKKCAERGLKIRLIFPNTLKEKIKEILSTLPSKITENIEVKYLDKIPFVLLVDNRSAELNLPFLDGKMDYGTTFYSESQEFVEWAKNLFLHFWNKIKEEEKKIQTGRGTCLNQ